MLKFTLNSLFAILTLFVFAQQGDGGTPKGLKTHSLNIYKINFPSPDIKKLKEEDVLNDKSGNGPWRFGYNHNSNINLTQNGTWDTLPNGDLIWRVEINCPGALTINLTFSDVQIPEGNELYVYNPKKDFILGKFTAYHTYQGQLGTELVPGETSIVEYYVPKRNLSNKGALTISTVTHGYRTSTEFTEKTFGQSGNCNMNVNCPDGSVWQNQRNAVLMLVSGSNGFCSGALVNNTANDGKPYVLTANHCYNYNTNVASWIFRFNYQSPDCNNPASDPTNFQSLSGSVLRARRTPTDFCLVEITGGLVNNTVPSNCNPYFNGWDNTGAIPNGAVSIHHPSGDIKKISFDDASLSISQGMSSTEPNSTWTVEWDRNTTTEGGSSGSPLFDLNRRIIGQLWGGSANCGNLTANDYYGRFSMSWNPPSSDQTNQLKYWLDPSNIGATIIDGFDPNGTALALDGTVGSITGASGVLCNTNPTPSFTLTNLGTTPLTSATIQYGYDGSLTQTFNWSGNLSQFANTIINLPSGSSMSGNHTFNINLTHINGSLDPNTNNNSSQATFMGVVGGNILTLNLKLDCYGSETTWEFRDNSNNQLLYSGGPYADLNNPIIETQNFCLNDGCFKFSINDEFGDGMSGCALANGGNGSYAILNGSDTLIYLDETNANFGSNSTKIFCFPANAGLNENQTINVISYPNPINNSLTIESELPILNVSIYQITGSLVSSKSYYNASVIEIPFDNIANGIYQMIIQTEKGNKIQKIQVQH